MRCALAIGLVCALGAGPVQRAQAQVSPRPRPAEALAGLDALVEKALADQKIPGAAVGVVLDGQVVWLKGYGRRDIEAGLPMTPDTLLPVASVTKQFTVAALGTLVRQGKLAWDQPVRNYLPDFRLHDDHATLRATPRDLVTHRIGLPRHDFAWFGSPLAREQLVARLRYLPFNKDIRTRFQYNNFMFMTAGYLAGRVAGSAYEDLVRTALLQPLGMTRTHFSLAELARDANAARGYQLDKQRRLVLDPFESAEPMAPTGGLNSTARDLTSWMRMLLAGGELDGRRVLLAADVAAMLEPQMPVGRAVFPELGFSSYGMGFFVGNYRGIDYAQHGGNLPGAATMVLLAPKERLGVVLLTNRSGARLRDGLPYEILDRLLGRPGARLVERFAELETKALAGEDAAQAAGVSDRKPGTRPSHALEEYAGRYADAGYGPLDVKLEGGVLRLVYNGFNAPLEHWHYDSFQTPQDPTSRLDGLRVQFRTDLEGEVSEVAVPLEPNAETVVFKRQPPPRMLEAEFLRGFVGRYEVGGVDAEVVLREDGVLQLVQLGRINDLVPVRGTLFRIKDLAGVSVEFLTGPDGQVDRLAIHSGGSVIAPRRR